VGTKLLIPLTTFLLHMTAPSSDVAFRQITFNNVDIISRIIFMWYFLSIKVMYVSHKVSYVRYVLVSFCFVVKLIV